MIKIRNIRDRFTPISFKFGVTDIFFAPFEFASEVLGIGTDIYKTERQASSVDATNQINYQIAKEKNEQEKELFYENLDFQDLQGQISRDFNAVEAQKARDFNAEQAEINRQFQTVEAQKTRDFNAIDAQVSRAKAAGVNPALVAGQGQLSSAQAGGSAASGGAASSSPVNGSPIPLLTAPVMQNKVQALEGLSHLGLQMSEISKNFAEAKNIDAKTKTEFTYQDYQKDLLSMNIKLSKVQEAKLWADVNQVNEYIKQIQADVQKIQAITNLTNQEVTIKEIEKHWKSDECQALINKLKSETNWNDYQVEMYKYLLPVQIGFYKSQQAVNYANSHAAEAAAKLSVEQANEVRALASLYQTNNAQALLDYSINRTYGWKNAKENYYQNKAHTDIIEYNANDAVQIIGTTTQVLNSVAGAAQSAAQVGAAAKFVKAGIGSTTVTKPQTWTPKPLYY